MKRNFRRTMGALLLTLVLCLSPMSVAAFATDGGDLDDVGEEITAYEEDLEATQEDDDPDEMTGEEEAGEPVSPEDPGASDPEEAEESDLLEEDPEKAATEAETADEQTGTEPAGEEAAAAEAEAAALVIIDTEEALRAAVEAAADGDTIELAGDIDLSETLEFDKSLTFKAADGAGEVTLTTSSGYRHFLITGGEVYLTTENVVLDGGGVAGGIRSDAAHLILNASIQNCIAQYDSVWTHEGWYTGGGVYASNTLTITGGRISGNFAEVAGGGVFGGLRAKIIILGGEICNNSVNGKDKATGGGGIYAFNESYIFVDGGKIFGNISHTTGGGIYAASRSTITVENGEIYDNVANDAGGGIYGHNGSIITMSGGDIYRNSSEVGGGIACNVSATITIEDGSISDNLVNNVGGGIYVHSGSTITINGGEISGNMAHHSGGGIHIGISTTSSASGIINGGRIVNNTAIWGGGGVLVTPNSTLKMLGGEISRNCANTFGGGIFASYSYLSQVEIRNNSIVKDNVAEQAYYMTNPTDIALHNRQIDSTVTWTEGFDYIYNNYDIAYEWGDPVEPSPNPSYTVTIISKYLDGLLEDDIKTYQVAHGDPFSEPYELAEGYQYVGAQLLSTMWGVDTVNRLVNILSVERDMTIELLFDRIQYNVKLTTRYADGAEPETVDVYQVPHGASFSQVYRELLEGYGLVSVSPISDELLVNPDTRTVSIDSVTGDWDIVLVFDRLQYNVTITVSFQDGGHPTVVDTYTVPYGDLFQEFFVVPEGYSFGSFMADDHNGLLVHAVDQYVRIASVIRDVNVYIVLVPVA